MAIRRRRSVKRKRPKRKRSFKRRRSFRRGRGKRMTNVPKFSMNWGLYWPERCHVKLKYSEAQKISTLLAGTGSYFALNCNGLYDPEFKLGGHQAYGFDQMAGLYSLYTVNAARLTLRGFTQTNPEPNITPNREVPQASKVIIVPRNVNVFDPSMSDWAQYSERPYATTGMIGLIPNRRPISNFVRCHRIAGLTKTQYHTNDAFWGVTSGGGSNPANLIQWLVIAENVDPIFASEFSCHFHITYYCTFFRKYIATQSVMEAANETNWPDHRTNTFLGRSLIQQVSPTSQTTVSGGVSTNTNTSSGPNPDAGSLGHVGP